MSTAKPYCTLFTGILTQESALIVAGSDSRNPADHSIARDGLERPTLAGRALAGALIASARKIFATLPNCITSASERDAHRASAWRLFTSHPCDMQAAKPDLRAHVAIRQDTGAQAKGKLFDTELLPRGLQWPFLLEVRADLAGDDYACAVRIAVEALHEWAEGRLWLGMGVARGPGWMRLSRLREYALNSTHVEQWPNALERTDSLAARIDAVEHRFKEAAAPIHAQTVETSAHGHWTLTQAGQPATDTTANKIEPTLRAPWWYAELNATLRCGQNTEAGDGYGWDAVAVGGHASADASKDLWLAHLCAPVSQKSSVFKEAFNPDHTPALAQSSPGGEMEPIIPGSAIRGPLRHALSRDLRSRGHRIHDPASAEYFDASGAPVRFDPVAAMFGDLDADRSNASSLLVRDAHIQGDWSAAWLHHHAEDEFTQGTYASAKFDSVVLMEASFQTRLVIEAPTRAEVETHIAFFDRLLPLLQAGHIAVGGGQWAGLGWMRWQFDPATQTNHAANQSDSIRAPQPTEPAK